MIDPLSSIRILWADLSGMFFPKCCPVCHRALVEGEELLCMECVWKIPRTGYHLCPDNPLSHRLTDLEVPIERCASFFHYKNENAYSSLIREAKYNGYPEINRHLARLFARELRADGFFDGLDLIVPVPVHWWKRLRRGYNQTDYIAQGLGQISGVPVSYDFLTASRGHRTQTRKSAQERRKAMDNVFSISASGIGEISPRGHILIVDDVITTGSTILSCARCIHRALPDLRISVLSLASTKLH